ncbi:Cell division protein DivIC (FtsB), stabilizes FtsL against RasP cleavage [Escherichia coli ISC7]|uniref:Cell division protein FtsB n=4 Tax=Gammaproteobacteria TaxID=1236 RepID=W1EYZ1_ECOLX|nr:Cell division protein DivIC (FtsB), stabilizes FtsL against RasP cleavage [Escherichia coli ISC7]
MGKLTLLLLAILVWLQYSLWFGKNGIHDYTRVNDDVAAQQATNAKLKARNDQLFAEIDDLNGGQEALEERARNELSMTRPGETFFIVWCLTRRSAHSLRGKTIDKSARELTWQPLIWMFAPWFRRPDLAVECKRNVLSNISQSVIKPFLNTRCMRCWRIPG